MYAQGSLKLVTYNVRGLNTPEKRKQVLRELRAHKASVAFLQETHFKQDKQPSFKDSNFPTGYFSNYTGGKSRGTAIVFSRDIPFIEKDIASDPEGRFLFLKGQIAEAMYTFASIYLPNKAQHKCLANILKALSAFQEGVLILAGDFNVALNPKMDTSLGSTSLPHNILAQIRRTLDSHQLVDVWRAFHGGERGYSFYSPVHKIYSRIDYIFIPQYHFQLAKSADIHVGTWSDHSPLSVQLDSPLYTPRERTWRLNLSLLTDPGLLEETKLILSNYFRENVQPETSFPTVWEAHKAVIRGFLISKGTAAKKIRQAQITDLLTEIRALEIQHAATGDPLLYQSLLKTRSTLTTHLSSDLKFKAIKTNAFYALNENKPGKLLAQLLQSRRTKAYIPRLQLPTGHITIKPDLIAEDLRAYFASLYSIQSTQYPQIDTKDISTYLKRHIHHTLSGEEATKLGSPILEEELALALKQSKAYKCPGPDGLPAEYYKLLKIELIPHMLSTFNSLLEEETFHQSTLAATITLIPKPGKDLLFSSSYRPISLLNSDVKLLARVLATRLQHFLPRLVEPDQVGFIPGREARDATSRVINAIALAQKERIPLLLLSTDAEKAFDRVLWPYLNQALKGFGLGDGFLKWISALYSNPTARVRVNGALTPSFAIQNGTRQGCPLSPLLFALALEPLLTSIRGNADIPGLPGESHQHKVSAYADDLMFFLSQPEQSLPAVVNELNQYGALAGLAINIEKSEILNISLPEGRARPLRHQFQFRWCANKIKYLGVWICADLARLTTLNYDALLQTLQGDLASWTSKYLSWFGRIGVLKMNVLPRVLYLLQTLPLKIPRGFLLQLRKAFLTFIWANQRPRLKYSVMCRPTSQGGLALPDVRLYYHASHLTRILDWMTSPVEKRWIDLESALAGRPTWVLPWLLPGQLPAHCRTIPTIGCTLRIWHLLRTSHSLSSFPAPLLPITHNPAFPGRVLPSLRERFTPHNRLMALHVLSDEQFKHIPTIEGQPEPSFLERFNYAQIKHFLLSLPNGTQMSRPLRPFETFCQMAVTLHRSLSTLYQLLQAIDDTLPDYVQNWDTCLGTVTTESQWRKTFALIHHSTPITKLKETSFKLTAMWYTTPLRLSKFLPSVSPLCWRCALETGSYLHIWWQCSRIAPFWRAVRDLIRHITDLNLDLLPEIFLLSHLTYSIAELKKSIILRILLAARTLIPLHWKSTTLPSTTELVTKIGQTRTTETSHLSPENFTEAHSKTWFYWDSFVSSRDLTLWRDSLPEDQPDELQHMAPDCAGGSP
uniref:Reverse transcriptase domain-containing protein n=1 Tax=Leptobrachium leishanense TaxID=445787 RepID=A0A8C5PTB1_9ANUR